MRLTVTFEKFMHAAAHNAAVLVKEIVTLLAQAVTTQPVEAAK